MFRHNFLLLFRNFKRFKSVFFINLIGLTTGLACTLLIYLWVSDELSADQFHVKNDRLFIVMEHRLRAGGIWTASSSPGMMAETLAAEMPEVEHAVSFTSGQTRTFVVNDKKLKAQGRATQKDFFKMFSYELIEGNADRVLVDKNAIVLSEALAIKLFNTTENIVGKSVLAQSDAEYTVTGVFKNVPSNATFQFDFVTSYEKYREGKDWLLHWGNTNVRTLVLLKEGADAAAFDKKIAGLIKVKTNNEVTHRTPFLKPYGDMYLYGEYENGVLTGGRITYVKLFSAIALFILVIACINFMNLSTAKASRRIKEVGIKKAVGAARGTLVFQYLSESLFMSFFSLLVAFLLVDLLLPQFNIITGKQLDLSFDPTLVLTALGIALITGIIAGSYPALYLSGFNPAAVLKGKLSTSTGELWARKGLVVVQFTLSILFIVSVFVVYKQIEFVQSTYIGYNKDNLLYIEREGKTWETEGLETLIAEIKNVPGVENVSSISHDMTGHNSGTYGVQWEGKDPEDKTEFENVTVNYGMIETLGIEMLSGRTFSPAYSDSSRIIFNEAAIRFMGMTDPIGKTVKLWGKDMEIVGVAKDFHYETLHEKVKPVFIRVQPQDTYLIMVKLAAGKEQETIAKLRDLYLKLNPEFSFDYHFLDEDYQSQYVAEQRVSQLSRYFAGLAILISCLGLFGLAAFTAERRLKEIGIRKALGASVYSVVALLSADFTKIVLAAVAIALPLSYYFANQWLDTFAFRIPLKWWYLAGAGVLALFIAWLTVGTQALKAAKVNPTKCLKEE